MSSNYRSRLAAAWRLAGAAAALLLALGAGSAAAQKGAEPPQRSVEVRRSVHALADALTRRDRDRLAQLLAPDFVLRSTPDIARDEWLHNAITLCWGDRADIEALEVRLRGDVAVASFQLTLYVDPGSCRPAVLRSLVTDVWTRGPDGWQLQLRHSGPPPASGAIAAQYGAAPARPPVWQIDGELSFVSTGGNASTRTLGLGSHATHRRTGGTTELAFAFLTSEDEAVTQARSVKTHLRHGIALPHRVELFGRGAYARDRFAGIEHRFGLDTGLAYTAALPRRHALTIEGSIGWTAERRRDASRLRFAALAATVAYRWTIAPGTELAESASLIADVESAGNWRGTNTLALAVTLTRLLSLKASHAFEYRNLPVGGFGRMDTRTAAALVFTFERSADRRP